MIRRKEWEKRCKRAKKDTSSSMSGLHFGHYKARAQSQIISHFHALKTSLLLRRGIAPDRWSHGFSVMPEKMFGLSLVTKLLSILLMEADFNFSKNVSTVEEWWIMWENTTWSSWISAKVHSFLTNSKESTRGKVWVSRRVWLGNTRTPRIMCTDTPDSANAISCNNDSKKGMGETM